MKFGYARVSTQEQSLDRQIDLLQNQGCDEILKEKLSGTIGNRPELNKLFDKIRSGDTIVVESFSRLGRSTKNLIEIVDLLKAKGVELISLKENFDTSTAQGRLMLTVFQAFSQFERDLIAERTREGLHAARIRGRRGGRRPVSSKVIDKAMRMYKAGNFSISEITTTCGISKATLYRHINRESDTQNNKNHLQSI